MDQDRDVVKHNRSDLQRVEDGEIHGYFSAIGIPPGILRHNFQAQRIGKFA